MKCPRPLTEPQIPILLSWPLSKSTVEGATETPGDEISGRVGVSHTQVIAVRGSGASALNGRSWPGRRNFLASRYAPMSRCLITERGAAHSATMTASPDETENMGRKHEVCFPR